MVVRHQTWIDLHKRAETAEARVAKLEKAISDLVDDDVHDNDPSRETSREAALDIVKRWNLDKVQGNEIVVGTRVREARSGVVVALEPVTYETTGKTETYARINWGDSWNRRPLNCLVPVERAADSDYPTPEKAARVIAEWLSHLDAGITEPTQPDDPCIKAVVATLFEVKP